MQRAALRPHVSPDLGSLCYREGPVLTPLPAEAHGIHQSHRCCGPGQMCNITCPPPPCPAEWCPRTPCAPAHACRLPQRGHLAAAPQAPTAPALTALPRALPSVSGPECGRVFEPGGPFSLGCPTPPRAGTDSTWRPCPTWPWAPPCRIPCCCVFPGADTSISQAPQDASPPQTLHGGCGLGPTCGGYSSRLPTPGSRWMGEGPSLWFCTAASAIGPGPPALRTVRTAPTPRLQGLGDSPGF